MEANGAGVVRFDDENEDGHIKGESPIQPGPSTLSETEPDEQAALDVQ